ncbi:competence protein ComEC [Muriicola jejuensis]|uniref:DUF4131 domain-containing protein n=1 Tax=Muriicola jejuensis TaxID=504488 RepID=A0A6P0UMY2_9FLAO|nr:ComEC/Rec2 family competence protein [Muriicola jejuensis]NER11646.1 DUF4131 domain-containing protein [Muriicola jejuensis]SMP25723.1 competence protein ComEC [Muriicola jejuensis]
MNFPDFISVRLCISFVAGITLGWIFPQEPSAIMLPLVLSLAALILTFFFENYRRGILFGIAVLCTSTCLGILSISLAQPRFSSGHYSHSMLEGENLWDVRVKDVLKSSAFYNRYLLEVKGLNGQPAGGLLLAKEKRPAPTPLEVDDYLWIRGEIKPVPSPSNPYEFAFDQYMEVMGVYDQVTLENGSCKKRESSARSIRGFARKSRESAVRVLEATSMGQKERGVLQAILLGERDDLDPKVYGHYRDAGAAHILAVSGLHIGILLLMIRVLLSPLHALRHGKTAAAVLSIVLIWAYALFTGLSPSVVRAAAMFSFLSYGLYLNRPTNTINLLSLSMLAILLVQPRYLFQVGFQLSYGAVLAIAWIYPLLVISWCPRSLFLKKCWKLVAVSLAAQIGVLPLCLYYFHQFPGLFLLSAFLLIPFLGLIIGVGIAVVILGSLQTLPDMLARVYAQMIHGMNEIVRVIAEQEAFVLREIPLDKISLLLLYLLLAFLVLSFQKPRNRTLLFLGISVLCLQGWTYYQVQSNSRRQEVLLLHRVAQTGILFQNGRQLHLYSGDLKPLEPIVRNFQMYRYLERPVFGDMPVSFTIGRERWIVVDSTGIVPRVSGLPLNLILTGSPKVHLGRILKEIKPRIVVADGSNYLQFVERWRKTCKAYGIPFYDTGASGALPLHSL